MDVAEESFTLCIIKKSPCPYMCQMIGELFLTYLAYKILKSTTYAKNFFCSLNSMVNVTHENLAGQYFC